MIQHLAEIANFLGMTPSVDTEAIQGRSSYEERVELLRFIIDLVEASSYAGNPEWRSDITKLELKLSEYTKQDVKFATNSSGAGI